jgi:asparagine synthase (glutamine-hydrolysing)
MCGIIGWWNKEQSICEDLFNRMRDTLLHRGPDGYGTYINSNGNFALGHRRLSFLDLSEAGSQPISNEDGSIWLSINGEIYNYKELRAVLEQQQHVFKSETDSEILIHAYEEWGMAMISRLEGMFAFGLWDDKNQKLILARDRFGIKPLYYYIDNKQIIFASEIKAIIENPDIERIIDYQSMADYFVYRFVPSPKTIFKNIFKLEPANYIEISEDFTISKTQYFELNTDNKTISKKALLRQVDEILRESVKIHIRSDVPVGSFLSGGYDSSLLVKYFSEFEKGFNTFSIGFKNWDKSEHRFAELVADKFGTNHYSEIIDNTSLDLLQDLVYFYDEPIADISIIPTFQVSKLASKHNKTVLSGEGADELFAGYTWHRNYLWHISKAQIKDAKKWGWELPLNNFDIESYTKAMAMGQFDSNGLKFLFNKDLHCFINDNTQYFYQKFFNSDLSKPKRFQILDIKSFMGELVLTKIDRASMANSLEVRVPFLSSKLSKLMLSLNPSMYFDNKIQKPILRRLLKKHLPSKIINRPKQGFTGPDSYYMDFNWYKKIFEVSELVNSGIINKQAIEKYMNDKDHWKLWKIAVMEIWFRKWMV